MSTIGAFEGRSDESLAEEVKTELQAWFGDSVAEWKLLRNYRIPYAQPNQASYGPACTFGLTHISNICIVSD